MIGSGGTATLSVIISAIDKTSGVFGKMGKNLEATGAKMKSVGKGMTMGLTLPIVGAGIAAGKMSMDFGKSMANVSTLVDTSTESMGDMKKEVLELSKRVPVALSDLSSSLYDVRSAGISSADAMGVLETSGRLAVAGLSTTEEATNLLTSAINVYGDESHDSNVLAEILFKTVKYGKTTVAELSQGFGKVAAIAKETGISIEDLSGATAVLTTGGIKAAEAQTALKAMISNVLKPTAEAEKAAKKLGIQFDLGALQSKGLSGMLAEVGEKAGTDKQAMADLFGSTEAANAIFSLTSEEGGAALDDILKDIGQSTGALDEAFEKQKETVAASAEIMKNKLNAAMIALGDKILPLVMPMVEKLTKFVEEMSDKFSKLSPKMQKIIIIILGVVAAIGPLLYVGGMIVGVLGKLSLAVKAFGTALSFLAAHPIILIIIALVALGAAIYMIIKHWDAVKAKTLEVWNKISAFMDTTLGKIVTLLLGPIGLVLMIIKHWDLVKESTIKVWNAISSFFTGYWERTKAAFWEALEFIKNLFFNWTVPGLIIKHWDKIKNATLSFIKGVKDVFWGLINWFKELPGRVWDAIKAVADKWDTLYGKVKHIRNKIIETFKGLVEWFKDLPNKIWNAIKSIPGKLKDAFKIPEISKPSWMPSWMPSMLHLPIESFQKGGIVPGVGPVPAIVHGGETIIPKGKGVGDINITITGNSFMSDRDAAEKIGDMIIEKLRMQLRI